MRKTPVICSLLMALGMSTLMIGCEPAGKNTKPPARTPGLGSTTGGGAEVPVAPSKGAAETPKVEAPKTEEPKAEAPKVEEPKAEAPKVEEPKVEEPKA